MSKESLLYLFFKGSKKDKDRHLDKVFFCKKTIEVSPGENRRYKEVSKLQKGDTYKCLLQVTTRQNIFH